jgi:molybdenum cofactor sulfurtransferase
VIERFSADMIDNLYGNPHSVSTASQNTSKRVEEARLRLLHLFNASPDDYEVVFVANATAGIKLVMDAFRDVEEGYYLGYHKDSHTSLIGMRESAKEHVCFASDEELETWLDSEVDADKSARPRLLAYPAQSNMNGRRLPFRWCGQARMYQSYTLLDAAAYVSTSPLDLSNVSTAPDFTVMSLYKIFGFPDLGALIVRKASSKVLQKRKYFGGGTVDMVVCQKAQWHIKKSDSLHEQLEDGTLPIHSIMALHSAIDVHHELFGAPRRVSEHCAFLARKLHDNLAALCHGNGLSVCEIYKDPKSDYSDTLSQGPIIAFNIRNVHGGWVPNSEVEKLATVRNIQLRTGGLCNPGGIASYLQLEPWEMKRNFSAGQRCGQEGDVMHGKPTGMIRLSLGAMSTLQDVETFVEFMEEFFVEQYVPMIESPPSPPREGDGWYVESLMVFPIKSCAGYRIPPQVPWHIHPEGLAWDREWCLVRPGTGAALSQKRYPRMALIKPTIDFNRGNLRVSFTDRKAGIRPITIPLSDDQSLFSTNVDYTLRNAKVCGDTIAARTYLSPAITEFFSKALGVACQLARLPSGGSSSQRHAKAHLQAFQQQRRDDPYAAVQAHHHIPGSFPAEHMTVDLPNFSRPILLSNESPILMISRSSLNRLNEQIKANGGKAVHAEAFRANIVVAEYHSPGNYGLFQDPYVEDAWKYVRIGKQCYEMMGSCRRCQMVCIDQQTGKRAMEPFSTLAKTRRFDGKVYFGQHACHVQITQDGSPEAQAPTIELGEQVMPAMDGDEFAVLMAR